MQPAEQYRLAAPADSAETEQEGSSVAHHCWWYFPQMQREEVLLIKQFDSQPTQGTAQFCFHTSFKDSSTNPEHQPRQTIEVRAVAIFLGDNDEEVCGGEDPTVADAQVQGGTANTSGGCDAMALQLCSCAGACGSAKPLPPLAASSCSCKNGGNPYHTCVERCGCACFSSANRAAQAERETEEPVPIWVEHLYEAENSEISATSNIKYSLGNASAKPKWSECLLQDIVMRHSDISGKYRSRVASGCESVLAAGRSMLRSPLNRVVSVSRFKTCATVTGQVTDERCAVVEGTINYDHKTTRQSIAVAFVAHLVFMEPANAPPCLLSRHTFSDFTAVDTLLSNQPMLETRLFAGASNGFLPLADVPDEYDEAVRSGEVTPEGAIIAHICSERGVVFCAADWNFWTGL